MAEGLDQTTEDLEQEITCAVCLEHFEDPRVLPCSHYYCRRCIDMLSKQTRSNRPFSCPECRTDIRLPSNDPSHLPKALSVNRLKDLYARLAEKPIPVAQKPIPVAQKPIPVAQKMCMKHNDSLILFCFDCNCLICRDCSSHDHKTHTHKFVSRVTPECREVLVEKMSSLKKVEQSFAVATHRTKAMIAEIDAQKAENTKAINQWVEGYIEIMQSYGSHLINEVSTISDRKTKKLKAQLNHFEGALIRVNSVCDSCVQKVECATDEELEKRLFRQLDKECQKHSREKFELAEVSDVAVKLPSSQPLSEMCRKEAYMCALEINSELGCVVNVANFDLNQTSFLDVFIVNRNGNFYKSSLLVQGEMKSLVDGSVSKITVTPTRSGGYSIAYTPQIRGRHQLTVTVNGKLLPGSHLNLYANVLPSKLGKQEKAISDLPSPHCVAVNSSDDLFITVQGEIQVFSTQGKKLRTFRRIFNDPQGIGIDEADNVFVADCKGNRVYKLNKFGNQLKITGRSGSRNAEFNHPRGMAVSNDCVFVCDSGNHRIQVFTRDLVFVKSIGSFGTRNGQFNYVYDISQDESGNLYACDYSNHRIQVFNSDGKFLFSFGTNGKGSGQLNRPAGVCVSNGFVYVSEYGNVRVSVFDRNGHCVCLFDTGGGWFSYLSTVRVDRDGFLYVCDFNKGRVQIF